MLRKISLLRPVVTRHFSSNFASSANANYIEQMYAAWIKDPTKVHASWNAYFSNIDSGIPHDQSFIDPSTLKAGERKISSTFKGAEKQSVNQDDVIRQVNEYVNAVRALGHYKCDLDPLKLEVGVMKPSRDMDFDDLNKLGFPLQFLNTPFEYKSNDRGFQELKKTWTPKEIFDLMKKVYCGKIGFQYTHIPSNEVKDWIRLKIEKDPLYVYSKEQKLDLLDRILESQVFSMYLEKKFSTAKRFGCEGIDSSISGLVKVVENAKNMGVRQINIGMAHRGRLNVLGSVLKKSYDQILAEFENVKIKSETDEIHGFSGDVKYHMGSSNKVEFSDGKSIMVNLLPNPSHLEAINPVVLGQTLAIQNKSHPGDPLSSVALIIHGDAAIAGQGINYEIQQMELLKNYNIGGAIHVVFNNQIGFTTDQNMGRTSYYCSALAKLNNNFVIHVNADEPQLVDFAFTLALEYKLKFKRDVFIDLVGYRKFGHNEQDQPTFTQPSYVKQMSKIKPMYLSYCDKLIKKGIADQKYIDSRFQHFENKLKEAHEKTKKGGFNVRLWDLYDWNQQVLKAIGSSSISVELFKKIGQKITALPQNANIHHSISKIYQERAKSIETGELVEWALAESLALGSLLVEGHSVRFAGEDSERGTFSNRHAVITDQVTNKKFCSLKAMLEPNSFPDAGNFVIFNTLLSEYAALGFEFGYSWAFPNDLVIWEAQFGDFANGAQIIIDQFIMSAERKWGKRSALVMLLPHGYDGQGPEHSNGRIERFLANINDDFHKIAKDKDYRDNIDEIANARVMNLTTTANYFHALRNQLKGKTRKPLIVFSPKKLLRDKRVKSDMKDFVEGSSFVEIIDDTYVKNKKQTKVILFCSGQVYFDLEDARNKKKLTDQVAIIRLEKIAPFPYNFFEKVISTYPTSAKVVWVSEEPLNFGSYGYLQNRINLVLNQKGFKPVEYVGRSVSSVTSVGSAKENTAEAIALVEEAFSLVK